MKKFFISSTFYDMHAERDMIQNIVQPADNQKLNEQGEYVSFSDLRWGGLIQYQIQLSIESWMRVLMKSILVNLTLSFLLVVDMDGSQKSW